MRRPVWMRARVEHELRRRFKKAAKRAGHYPSEAIRMFMEYLVEIDLTRTPGDLTVWRESVQRAAEDAANALWILGEQSPARERAQE
ncbi:hypothetical protein [Stenotrophomonas sp.]|uniref:hypothetical protein n=1 Tax=Stenotrophomonas sp. TaxID=69392 RepID=UPI00289F046B|nr:hypothetical protein [Stenotrophomonas sp.]